MWQGLEPLHAEFVELSLVQGDVGLSDNASVVATELELHVGHVQIGWR